MKGTVAVAMSGGVDSSVAAAILAEGGDRLVGFSMKLVDQLAGEEERYGKCCSPDDFRDARLVAGRFGFPHYTLDMEDEFRRFVLDPFLDDYAAGKTPSPCIRCNTFMKFGSLLGRARAVGADRVATGHYAILEPDPVSGRTLLRKAVDETKDQSYFLFDLSEEQRRHILFPLGRMTKKEVRQRAEEFGLAVASKTESMDLCFVAEGDDYRSLLARERGPEAVKPGEMVDREGNVLASHDGIGRFTVGQRKGLGVQGADKLYVIGIDPGTDRVTIGTGDDLLSGSCVIDRVRWIPFEKPSGPVQGTVRIRSTHEGAPATITDHGDGSATIRFDEPQRAITPGQAAVAYDGDLVLGGGWVRNSS
ncbi:MAG: tRNA 2-thiouridine(34) synthase MnmA [Acidobacteria bacterium]|uniref:tRNA-specific 2-thiouridylase MnmA n=1 Tax=Candidatus Polarisedimenticola svalbardensis TaxID=2886004 RepID=A0A8J6Y6R7_9BACT|nr:tRNA 2-thiouridine(34) synthase MnmA [Candidatus Polarisedimenticola svalbardensis]